MKKGSICDTIDIAINKNYLFKFKC